MSLNTPCTSPHPLLRNSLCHQWPCHCRQDCPGLADGLPSHVQPICSTKQHRPQQKGAPVSRRFHEWLGSSVFVNRTGRVWCDTLFPCRQAAIEHLPGGGRGAGTTSGVPWAECIPQSPCVRLQVWLEKKLEIMLCCVCVCMYVHNVCSCIWIAGALLRCSESIHHCQSP